jgi:hypothetical protein
VDLGGDGTLLVINLDLLGLRRPLDVRGEARPAFREMCFVSDAVAGRARAEHYRAQELTA